MLINVSGWNGLYKTLFAWESSPKLLNPSVGEFMFINPLVEGTVWWHDTRAGPLAEVFKPKLCKKKKVCSVLGGTTRSFGQHRDHPGTAQTPRWLRHQDRPDGSSAGQRMTINTENQFHPSLKHYPTFSLPSSSSLGAAITSAMLQAESTGVGRGRWVLGMSPGRGGCSEVCTGKCRVGRAATQVRRNDVQLGAGHAEFDAF